MVRGRIKYDVDNFNNPMCVFLRLLPLDGYRCKKEKVPRSSWRSIIYNDADYWADDGHVHCANYIRIL